MNKDQAETLIREHLSKDEKLVDFFMAYSTPTFSFWWYLLIGPLAYTGTRQYFVGVTDKGIHFHKLGLMGKPQQRYYFTFEEVVSIKIRSFFLSYDLVFLFFNKRQLKLCFYKIGVHKKPAKLTLEILDYIKQKITP
ncbi:MAG: hypothetical protein V7776_21805 [Halopseudomonas aestusnigri]